MNRSIIHLCVALLLIGFGLFWHKPAEAQAVAVSCSASMTDVTFGNVNPQSSQTDTTGTLSYSCTNSDNNPQAVALCFNIIGQDTDPRLMSDGAGDSLKFQLYTDSTRTQPWGNPGFGTQAQGAFLKIPAGQTSSGSTTIYGRVTAGQTGAVPGSYTDYFLFGYFTFTTHTGGGTPSSCQNAGTLGFLNWFKATAQVTAQCAVNASTLDFGTPAGVLTSAIPGTSTISVQCAPGISYNVGLDGGQNSGNNINARKMILGGNSVTYQLYRDSGRSQVWGNTVGTNTVAGTGNGSVQSLTVYGQVPAQRTPPAGTYQDTVVVSVTY